MATATKKNETKKPPVHSIGPFQSRNGYIEVAIWENEHEEFTSYSVTSQRRYNKDGEWKTSHSYGRDDIPILQLALGKAHEWIVEKMSE